MVTRKVSLADAKLYLVLDREVQSYSKLFDILKKATRCGVDVVQLRDKKGTTRDIIEFSRRAISYLRGKAPFIINDRLDVALAVKADGVHLGQQDLPLDLARKIVGNNLLIGISCQTISQALRAQREGADYIGFGSVFKTLTKPDRPQMDLRYLASVKRRIRIPLFAIGGINLKNVGMIRLTGIDRVAVTRSLCLSRNVTKATRDFKNILNGGYL